MAVIIGGGILTLAELIVRTYRRPHLILVSGCGRQFNVETSQYNNRWIIKWTILNTKGTTAEGVKLSLHVMDMAGILSQPEGVERIFPIFDNLDIVHAESQQELPIEIQFMYVEGESDFRLLRFTQGFSTPMFKDIQATFPITKTKGFESGGYILTFQFSGRNLTDKDRRSKSWSLAFPQGLPKLKPFTRPPPNLTKIELPDSL